MSTSFKTNQEILNTTLYNKKYDRNGNESSIDLLFNKSEQKLKKFQIKEAENDVALNNLRYLITQLQTKRLRNKIKNSSDFFIL